MCRGCALEGQVRWNSNAEKEPWTPLDLSRRRKRRTSSVRDSRTL